MIKSLQILQGALRAALARLQSTAGLPAHVTGFTVLIERRALLPMS